MIPMIVELTLQSNLNQFSLDSYEVREYKLTLSEIDHNADLTMNESVEEHSFSLNEGMEAYTLKSGELISVNIGDADYYEGVYELTPSDNKQTLTTAGKTMSRNVVVNPIPSNYGKIGWNGSYLTVS